MLLSFVHSIKMCFIVYWFPHGHFGRQYGGLFSEVFFQGFVKNCFTSGFNAAFGAICENV